MSDQVELTNDAPITAAGYNDGANKGFWRVQWRNRGGQFMEMGRGLLAMIRDAFSGNVSSLFGVFVGGVPDRPGYGKMLFKDENGVYQVAEVSSANGEEVEARLPDEVLDDQNVKKKETTALADRFDADIQTREDMRIRPATKQEIKSATEVPTEEQKKIIQEERDKSPLAKLPPGAESRDPEATKKALEDAGIDLEEIAGTKEEKAPAKKKGAVADAPESGTTKTGKRSRVKEYKELVDAPAGTVIHRFGGNGTFDDEAFGTPGRNIIGEPAYRNSIIKGEDGNWRVISSKTGNPISKPVDKKELRSDANDTYGSSMVFDVPDDGSTPETMYAQSEKGTAEAQARRESRAVLSPAAAAKKKMDNALNKAAYGEEVDLDDVVSAPVDLDFDDLDFEDDEEPEAAPTPEPVQEKKPAVKKEAPKKATKAEQAKEPTEPADKDELAKEQAEASEPESKKVSLAELDAIATPESYTDDFGFTPSDEQTRALNAIVSGKQTSVEALAGSGKTTTLVGAAKALFRLKPDARVLSLQFNAANAAEAERRMPSNTWAKTTDALGRKFIADGGNKLQLERYRSKSRFHFSSNKDIAKHLEFEDTPIYGENFKPDQVAGIVRRAITKYSNGADKEIQEKHFDLSKFVPEGRDAADLDFPPNLLNYAKKFWADLNDEPVWSDKPDPKTGKKFPIGGKLRIDPSHATKMWALSEPDFSKYEVNGKPVSVVFFDEAQDTNAVMVDLIKKQKNVQIVMVGDPNQAIYGWRGAKNALQGFSKTRAEAVVPLTTTRRFGKNLIGKGNNFLNLLGAPTRVRSEKDGGTIVDDPSTIPDGPSKAHIVRSNAGGLDAIEKYLEQDKTVAVTKNFYDDLNSALSHIEWLKMDFADRKEKGLANGPEKPSEDFLGFNTWGDVINSAKDDDDSKSAKWVQLLDKYNGELDPLKAIADQIVLQRDPNEVEAADVSNLSAAEGASGVLFNEPKDPLTYVIKNGSIVVSGNAFAESPKYKKSFKDIITGGIKKKPYDKWIRPENSNEGDSEGWTTTSRAPYSQDGSWVSYFKLADDSDRQAYLDAIADAMRVEDRGPQKESDVLVTTAHRSKGLEWSDVIIGEDFRGPKPAKDDPEKIVWPSDEELRIAYVALTRAENSLFPGSLAWADEYEGEAGLRAANVALGRSADFGMDYYRNNEDDEAPMSADYNADDIISEFEPDDFEPEEVEEVSSAPRRTKSDEEPEEEPEDEEDLEPVEPEEIPEDAESELTKELTRPVARVRSTPVGDFTGDEGEYIENPDSNEDYIKVTAAEIEGDSVVLFGVDKDGNDWEMEFGSGEKVTKVTFGTPSEKPPTPEPQPLPLKAKVGKFKGRGRQLQPGDKFNLDGEEVEVISIGEYDRATKTLDVSVKRPNGRKKDAIIDTDRDMDITRPDPAGQKEEERKPEPTPEPEPEEVVEPTPEVAPNLVTKTVRDLEIGDIVFDENGNKLGEITRRIMAKDKPGKLTVRTTDDSGKNTITDYDLNDRISVEAKQTPEPTPEPEEISEPEPTPQPTEPEIKDPEPEVDTQRVAQKKAKELVIGETILDSDDNEKTLGQITGVRTATQKGRKVVVVDYTNSDGETKRIGYDPEELVPVVESEPRPIKKKPKSKKVTPPTPPSGPKRPLYDGKPIGRSGKSIEELRRRSIDAKKDPEAMEDALYEDYPEAKALEDGGIVVRSFTKKETKGPNAGKTTKFEMIVRKTPENKFIIAVRTTDMKTKETQEFWHYDQKDSYAALAGGKTNGIETLLDNYFENDTFKNAKDERVYGGIAGAIKQLRINPKKRKLRTPEEHVSDILTGRERKLNPSQQKWWTQQDREIKSLYEAFESKDSKEAGRRFGELIGGIPDNDASRAEAKKVLAQSIEKMYPKANKKKTAAFIDAINAAVDERVTERGQYKVPHVSNDGISPIEPGMTVRWTNNEGQQVVGRVVGLKKAERAKDKEFVYGDYAYVKFEGSNQQQTLNTNNMEIVDPETKLTGYAPWVRNDDLKISRAKEAGYEYDPDLEAIIDKDGNVLEYLNEENRPDLDELEDDDEGIEPYTTDNDEDGDGEPDVEETEEETPTPEPQLDVTPETKNAEDLVVGESLFDDSGNKLGEITEVKTAVSKKLGARVTGVKYTNSDGESKGLVYEPEEKVSAGKPSLKQKVARTASALGLGVKNGELTPSKTISKNTVADTPIRGKKSEKAIKPTDEAREIKNQVVEMGAEVWREVEAKTVQKLREKNHDISDYDGIESYREFLNLEVDALNKELNDSRVHKVFGDVESAGLSKKEVDKIKADMLKEGYVDANGIVDPKKMRELQSSGALKYAENKNFSTGVESYMENRTDVPLSDSHIIAYHLANNKAFMDRLKEQEVKFSELYAKDFYKELNRFSKDVAVAHDESVTSTLKELGVTLDGVKFSEFDGLLTDRKGRPLKEDSPAGKMLLEAFDRLPRNLILQVVADLKKSRRADGRGGRNLIVHYANSRGHFQSAERSGGSRVIKISSDTGMWTTGKQTAYENNGTGVALHEFIHYSQLLNPNMRALEHAWTFDRLVERDDKGNETMPRIMKIDFGLGESKERGFAPKDIGTHYVTKQYPRKDKSIYFNPNDDASEVMTMSMQDLFGEHGNASLGKGVTAVDGVNGKKYKDAFFDEATGKWYSDSAMTNPIENVTYTINRARGDVDKDLKSFTLGTLLVLADWSPTEGTGPGVGVQPDENN